jgi:hypothetical protein
VRVLASGVGDVDGPAEARTTLSGVSVRPPSPVHLAAEIQASGDVALSWVRRSRLGWRWIDAAEAPLGEEREIYRIAVTPDSAAGWTAESALPSFALSAAERGPGAVTVTIRQAGTHGDSPPVTLRLPG